MLLAIKATCRLWRAGRLVLEVFEDQAPLAARQLLNRCREGTRETLHNTHVHRLITDQGIFFGRTHGCGTKLISLCCTVLHSLLAHLVPKPCPSLSISGTRR